MTDKNIGHYIGRYEIKSELGRGGMSTVYLAYDPNVDRRVAIKLLPREFLHHEEFRERFDREARIIAALEHSAIVPIYDFGEEGGQPYFVMRHMSGGSLAEQLKKGALSVEEAAEIVERIGSALQYAHSRGIVHRDLKPGNILFDQFKTAYLADFGIARLEETGATLTGTVFMGTPAYMSPEQVQASHELDGRADIYALGIILYEMLTGKKPYEAPTAAGLALKHVIAPVPHILDEDPTLPPDAEAIISRAMAKNPDDRYPTAIEFTSDVNSLAAGQTIATGKPSETEDAGQKEQAGKAAAVAAGATLAGAAASAGPDDESAIEATAIAPAEMSAAVRAASAAQDTDDLKTTLAPAETSTAEVAGTAAASGASEDTALMEPAATAASTAAATPAGEEKKSRRGLIAILAVLVVLCLAAAAVALLVGGDSLFGFFSSPTATATSTITATASSEPTETSTATATVTATSTATATASATATEEPSATPTGSLAEPTLRPTLTPLPTNTFPPPTATFPPPTATNPPPPTSAPQPTSPPSKPTSPPSKPTSPPAAPTSPAIVDPGD